MLRAAWKTVINRLLADAHRRVRQLEASIVLVEDKIAAHAHAKGPIMSISAKPAEGIGAVEVTVESYGGAYDGAGDIVRTLLVLDLGPDEAYKLAAELVLAANKKREESGWQHVKGPFALVPARKKAEVMADLAAQLEELKKAPARDLHPYTPSRMMAWTLEMPADTLEFVRGISIDNHGGISTAVPAPAAMTLEIGGQPLMGVPYVVQPGEFIRLELRPLRPHEAP